MKFSISINQKSAIDSWIPLDLNDLAIIDYAKSWILSRKSEKIITPNGEFTWIDYKTLIREMPILGIKSKDVIARRLNALCYNGIFGKYYDPKSSRTFFRFWDAFDLLEWDECQQGGSTQKSEGVDSKVEGGSTQKSDYNNININTLNNNNSKEIKKEILVLPEWLEKTFPLLKEKLIEFFEYRKSIKKPIKQESFPAFIKKLEKLSGGNEEIAIQVLEESIANSWQWIFPLKNVSPGDWNFNWFTKKVWVAKA